MELLYLYFVLSFLVGIIASIRGRPGWRWFFIAVFTTPLVAGLLVMALPRQLPPLETRSPPVVPMRADSTIRVIRLPSSSDKLRPYRIFINGAEVGEVVDNSIVDFHVPSGELAVEARIDWGASLPLLIELPPGGRVNVDVSNRWGPVFGLWAMLFRRRRYLKLTQVPAEPGAARRADPVPAATVRANVGPEVRVA